MDKLTKATDGWVNWNAVREAFGKTTVAANSQMTYLLRFPGQWEDGVGGVNQNLFRDFSPSIGIYNNADPQITSSNDYSYVLGNPTNYFDHLGLFSSKLGFYVHKELTIEAIKRSKWNDKCQLAWNKDVAVDWSNDYDGLPEAQLIENSHTHAMSQVERYYDLQLSAFRIKRLETEAQAKAKTIAWVSENLNHSSCDAKYLGYALHTVQDYFAGGHRFGPWDGGWTPLAIPTFPHILMDTFPSQETKEAAIADSVNPINIWVKRCNICSCE